MYSKISRDYVIITYILRSIFIETKSSRTTFNELVSQKFFSFHLWYFATQAASSKQSRIKQQIDRLMNACNTKLPTRFILPKKQQE